MPISFVRIADEIKSKISYLRLLFMMKTGFVCPKLCSDILHDTHQLLFLGGAEHGDARLPEVGDALEDGACRQMPARMQDATVLFFFQAEDGIRDDLVTGVQTCALPIYLCSALPLCGTTPVETNNDCIR